MVVTDAWLGAILGTEVPFTDLPEFVERPDDLGIDSDATPSYTEVLELRADRVARCASSWPG